jgi:hypothetical protein
VATATPDINDKWARSRSPFTTGPYAVHVGVVMGYELYTANFKDRIGLGSDPILIRF